MLRRLLRKGWLGPAHEAFATVASSRTWRSSRTFHCRPTAINSQFVKTDRTRLAEREGFEPSVVSYTRFPSVHLKPLGHLSPDNEMGLDEKGSERVGFEPTVRVNVHLISSQAPSTTRTPLLDSYVTDRRFVKNAVSTIWHSSSRTPLTTRNEAGNEASEAPEKAPPVGSDAP